MAERFNEHLNEQQANEQLSLPLSAQRNALLSCLNPGQSGEIDLVLVHGWGLGRLVWAPVLEALCAHYRVHLFDLPGYAGAPSQADFLRAAQQLNACLPANSVLCAWSLGAMLALQAALLCTVDAADAALGAAATSSVARTASLRQRRISRLILVAATPCFSQRSDWQHAQPPEVLAHFAQAVADDSASALRRFISLINQGDAQARRINRQLNAIVFEQSAVSARAQPPAQSTLQQGLDWLATQDLRAAQYATLPPTLLVHGACDALIPLAAAQCLQAKLPEAQLIVLPHAAHTPFYSDPQRFVQAIIDFLSPPAPPDLPAQLSAQLVAQDTQQQKLRVRRAFDRAAQRYDEAALLQRDVCTQLFAGLTSTVEQRSPAGSTARPNLRVLDAGCGTGYGIRLLKAHWPTAQFIALDFAPAMLQRLRGLCAVSDTDAELAAENLGANLAPSTLPLVCAGDLEALPLAAQSVDLLWSSLAIQWCALPLALSEMLRVLRPGGQLAFSTLAAGSFDELERAFSGIDPALHRRRFLTVERIEAALKQCAVQHLRLRQQRITQYFPELKSLLRSIKAIGANTVGAGARKNMMGRAAWQKLEAAYETQRSAAGLPLSYELIFVYAEK
ncbi:MAG: malonyl-ACP O-methyltransferase BioC [Pseudomonadota bacterium]